MKRDCTLVLLTLNEIDGLRLLWDQIPVDQFNTVLAVDGGWSTTKFIPQPKTA